MTTMRFLTIAFAAVLAVNGSQLFGSYENLQNVRLICTPDKKGEQVGNIRYEFSYLKDPTNPNVKAEFAPVNGHDFLPGKMIVNASELNSISKDPAAKTAFIWKGKIKVDEAEFGFIGLTDLKTSSGKEMWLLNVHKITKNQEKIDRKAVNFVCESAEKFEAAGTQMK